LKYLPSFRKPYFSTKNTIPTDGRDNLHPQNRDASQIQGNEMMISESSSQNEKE
jgi:hypothetical protein